MTGNPSELVLLALLAFQAKHLLCDYVLQTKYQVSNKGFYGRRGGLVHAGYHALFSIPVLFILTRSVMMIAIAIVGEFLVHYHIDWLKARTERKRGWTTEDSAYWVAFGADQFAHQVTYLAMTALLMPA